MSDSKTQAAVCPSCGRLVGGNAKQCPHCGRVAPGFGGAGSWLDRLFSGGRPAVRWVFLLTITMGVMSILTQVMAGHPIELMSFRNSPLLNAGFLQLGAVQEGQWWRPVSCLFLHAGVLHLGVNMWTLMSIGRQVELVYGKARFVVAYLLTGLGGSLASMFGHGAFGASVGASGCLFGLIGLLVTYGRQRRDAAGRSFSSNLMVTALIYLLLGSQFPFLDNWAHGGGFVSGLLMGLVLKTRDRTIRGEGPDVRMFALSLMVVVAASLATVSWQSAAPKGSSAGDRAEGQLVQIMESEFNQLLMQVEQSLVGDSMLKAQLGRRLPGTQLVAYHKSAAERGEPEAEAFMASVLRLARLLKQNATAGTVRHELEVLLEARNNLPLIVEHRSAE